MLLRRSHRFPMQSAISNNRTAPRRLFRSTQSNVSSQCALPKKSPFKSVAIQGRGEPMGISTVDLYQIAGFNTDQVRSEEHTSELQSLMRISYAVFCLKHKIYIIIQRLQLLII